MSAELAELYEIEYAADYGICIAATLLIYDYALTFQQEQRYIWKSRWTAVKALFLFIRYMGLIDMAGFFYIEFGKPVSSASCGVVMYWLLCTTTVVYLCAGLVLALRTWAIWERSRICAALVGTAWLTVTVLVLIFLVYSMIGLEPYGNAAFPSLDLAGCGATNTPSTAAAALKAYNCLAVYEGLIFIITIARGICYLYTPSPLMLVLYRDAVLGSTCLVALTVTNAILSDQNSTNFYLPYLLSFALYFIIPCRIILNLRQATSSDDLHATTVQQPTDNDIALRNLGRSSPSSLQYSY